MSHWHFNYRWRENNPYREEPEEDPDSSDWLKHETEDFFLSTLNNIEDRSALGRREWRFISYLKRLHAFVEQHNSCLEAELQNSKWMAVTLLHRSPLEIDDSDPASQVFRFLFSSGYDISIKAMGEDLKLEISMAPREKEKGRRKRRKMEVL